MIYLSSMYPVSDTEKIELKPSLRKIHFIKPNFKIIPPPSHVSSITIEKLRNKRRGGSRTKSQKACRKIKLKLLLPHTRRQMDLQGA